MFENKLSVEVKLADRALQSLLVLMRDHVLHLIRELNECVIATLDRTLERSFSRMNTKMIKEIMPFSEDSITFLLSASKNSYLATCF